MMEGSDVLQHQSIRNNRPVCNFKAVKARRSTRGFFIRQQRSSISGIVRGHGPDSPTSLSFVHRAHPVRSVQIREQVTHESSNTEYQRGCRDLEPVPRRLADLRYLHALRGRMPRGLRDLALVVPWARGPLPRSVRRDNGRLGQAVPGRLLAREHPGLRRRRPGTSRGRRGLARHRGLLRGRHRDRVRLGPEGPDAPADLHGRARIDRDRPGQLGALRHRRRDLGDHPRLRRERRRDRPRSGPRLERQGHEVPRDRPADRDRTGSSTRATARFSSR